jgi:hypothetical protein
MNPHAVLQIAKTVLAQPAQQLDADRLATNGKIKQNHAPLTIPGPLPMGVWVASAQRDKTPPLSEPVYDLAGAAFAFDHLPLFQLTKLAAKTMAVFPRFERFEQAPQSWSH